MTARSPSAFFLAVFLHALFATVAVLTAWMLKEKIPETVRVFELVAGEGDNFNATEAPALGTPGGVGKVELPDIPKPVPKAAEPTPVAPVQPEPSPVKPAPAQPSPVQAVPTPKVEPKPTETKIPDFSKQVKRTADRKAANIMAKFQKEQKAKEAAQKKIEEEARKKMSKEDFDRLYGNKSNASQKVASNNSKASRIDAEGIAKGVVGGSTANKTGGAGGKALTAEEGSQLERYISMLIQRLKEAHESPPGVSANAVATVEFYLAANGAISRVRISKSSGDAEFDQSALNAFRKLPPQGLGPRPDKQGETLSLDFMAEDGQ